MQDSVVRAPGVTMCDAIYSVVGVHDVTICHAEYTSHNYSNREVEAK